MAICPGKLGRMPDIPMKRTLPSFCSSWSVSTVWLSLSCSTLGDMCTCTRSRRSVRSRRSDCSTSALTFAGL